MSKDSMRAAKFAAEEAEKKSKVEKTEDPKETAEGDEKIVVKLDESDSEKLATSLRLIAEKLDKQDSSMKKMEESIKKMRKDLLEIDELKKRVESFETSTEKCQNHDDLNSYIDRRISDKFKEAKASLDEMFDAKMKAFVDSLPKKAEEPNQPTVSTTPTQTQSPWRTIRQKIGEITESIKYFDGRSANNVVGEVIEERIYY